MSPPPHIKLIPPFGQKFQDTQRQNEARHSLPTSRLPRSEPFSPPPTQVQREVREKALTRRNKKNFSSQGPGIMAREIVRRNCS